MSRILDRLCAVTAAQLEGRRQWKARAAAKLLGPFERSNDMAVKGHVQQIPEELDEQERARAAVETAKAEAKPEPNPAQAEMERILKNLNDLVTELQVRPDLRVRFEEMADELRVLGGLKVG